MRTSFSGLAAIAAVSLAVVLLALLPAAASASSSPSTSTFSIQTSAPPENFVGVNETYVVSASVPVATWTVSGAHTLLSYVSGSQEATLHLFAPVGSEAISLEAQATGYSPEWQNWTLVTYSEPFLSGIPAFAVVTGEWYNYSVGNTTAGTYSFTGAPYLSLHAYTGGEYLSGTVTAGAYTNNLSLVSGAGRFSQYWVTSDSSLPATVSFSCSVGAHAINATMSLVSLPAGCGNEGLFVGETPYFMPAVPSYSESYSLALTLPSTYTAYVPQPITSGESTYAAINAYLYGTQGTAFSGTINSPNGASTLTFPSSGFATFTFDPPQVSSTVTPPPPPPTNGTGVSSQAPPAGSSSYLVPLAEGVAGVLVAAVIVGAIVYYIRQDRRSLRRN